MLLRQLFDPTTSTYTYLLADRETGEAVLIDPVLEQVDRDLSQIEDLGLKLVHAIDTHVHADHVTGISALRERTGCSTIVSERAGVGRATRLVKEGDEITFGKHTLEVRETPGHTNGCLTYVMSDRKIAFTGDALMIRGCGRTDFQGGSSAALYRSVHDKLFTLPGDTTIYPGHDYKGRPETTIDEEKRHNPRLGQGKTEEEFTAIMAALQLPYPKQIDRALPANLAAGMPLGLPIDAEPPPKTDWAPVERTLGGIDEVRPEWLAQHTSDVRVVDVREPDEYIGELGHVPGSELHRLETVADAAKSWDPEVPIVLVCRSGGRSGQASLQLRALGFRRVASMRGGMTAWHERRYAVDRAMPRSA